MHQCISGTIFFKGLNKDAAVEKLAEFNHIHSEQIFNDIWPTAEGFAVNLLSTVPDGGSAQEYERDLKVFWDRVFGCECLEFVSIEESEQISNVSL